MLDFDNAPEIEFTVRDVDEQLVPAVSGNDPYFPRPDVDEDLWKNFRDTYLKASKLILEAKKAVQQILKLPERFFPKMVEVIEKYADWNMEDNIVFG